MTKVILLIFAAALVSCSTNRETLREGGYQILDNYAIAIKLPCELEEDLTLTRDSTIGRYMIMVCPQIFTDTTRTSFNLDKLLESENFIYHLNIVTDSEQKSNEFLLSQQKQILKLLNIQDYEEIEVDGRKSLIYEIEEKRVTETFIPNSPFTYHVAISSNHSRREKLNEILKTIKIGGF